MLECFWGVRETLRRIIGWYRFSLLCLRQRRIATILLPRYSRLNLDTIRSFSVCHPLPTNKPPPSSMSARRSVGVSAAKKPVSTLQYRFNSNVNFQLGPPDLPAILAIGTDISAKFKGAFCEAKIHSYEKKLIEIRVCFWRIQTFTVFIFRHNRSKTNLFRPTMFTLMKMCKASWKSAVMFKFRISKCSSKLDLLTSGICLSIK
jgi:hypothetical protein